MATNGQAPSTLDRVVVRGATMSPAVAVALLAAMLVGLWVVVRLSGGTHSSTPHLMYIPIILATLPFGLRGSLATAVVAAVLVGPFMPLDVTSGEDQQAYGWVVRGVMFLAVGSVASLSLAVRERFYTQQLSVELRTAMAPAGSHRVDPTLVPLIPGIIEARSFHPVFQPIYSLADGRLVGVEALTRFEAEPYRTPDLWFAAAAEAGRGVELELAAIEAALRAVADLPPAVKVSVNASPATLSDPALLALVRANLDRQLTVEITEHAVIEDYHLLKEQLVALRAEGVRIAVDDAGAGVASLQHIVQLSPDVIKLDMSLTQHVGSSPFRRAMAGSLIEFAQRSGALLVVEGIEEQADLDIWQHLGAHAVQGYLVGRPGPLPPALTSPLIAAMRA